MITYKGYYVKKSEELPSLFVVVTEGRGGKIPNELKTAFTNISLAKFAIDGYLAKRET